MNVKDLFAQKETTPNLYWSLVLEAGYTQAGVWYIEDSQAKLIATSAPCPWEVDSELVGAVDAALSACIQKLPENYKEPEKTVFGVPSSWIEKSEITPQYLDKIKKICEELSLAPTGFVVIPEAIANLYKSQEGTPLSSIVLGLGREHVEMSVFKVGELIGTTTVARSVSIFDDVVEGLTRFESASPLPSRMIVYDGKGQELNDAADVLSGGQWDNITQFSFLHTPKIEILDSEKKVLATSLAGANEIAQITQIIVQEGTPITEVSNIEVPATPVDASDMGFFMDSDQEVVEEIVPQPINRPVEESVVKNDYANIQPSFGQEPAPKRNILHDLKSKFDHVNVPKFNFKFGGRFGVFLIGVLALFLALVAGWWFYPTADITIYISPKKLEQDLDINFGEEDIVSINVSGEKTTSATGKKIIGDRAKGSVLIQNGTSSNVNLKAGTILYSSGNLKFLVEDNASVSAALSPSEPGKATVAVSAESIGAEYNLGKDEVFKVGNYPKADVDGRSTADFSGGNSREILAVSADDREKIKSELTEELITKAKEELIAKATSDQIVIGDFVSTESVNESYDKKQGDEADSVKLSMEIEAKTILYDRKKLAEYVREKIKEKIPQGFVLRDTQIDYTFSFKEEDGGVFKYNIAVVANFLPEIKNDELKKKIAGKTLSVAQDYLSSIPGFSNAQITLRPLFPGRLGIIPMVTKNIEIEIAAEK